MCFKIAHFKIVLTILNVNHIFIYYLFIVLQLITNDYYNDIDRCANFNCVFLEE